MEKQYYQYQLINKIISQVLPDCKVLLFGSRAKGFELIDSDFDLLIVTKNNIDIREKMELKAKLRKQFAKFNIDADPIIESSEEVEIKKKLPGHIVRFALNEAIPI